MKRQESAGQRTIGSTTDRCPEPILVTDADEAGAAPWALADTWDYETTGLYHWRDETYALAVLMGEQPYVFVGPACEVARGYMRETIAVPGRDVIAYNAKFELHFTDKAVLDVRANIIDPSVALFLIDENRFSGSGHGLKHAVKTLFGYEMVDFKKMLGYVTEETGEYKTRKCKTCGGKGWRGRDHTQCESCAGVGMEARPVTKRRQRHISEVPLEELARYAADDVYWTKRVWEWAKAKLARNEILERNFYDVQMPLLVALYDAEHHGIRIDREAVIRLRDKYASRIAEIDAELAERTGIAVAGSAALDYGADDEEPAPADSDDDSVPPIRSADDSGLVVNLDSPAQVDWYIYTLLGLRRPPFRPKRKGKDGRRVASKWQTDENCLLWVWKHSKHDVPKLILERRKCAKYVGTYLNNMLEYAFEEAPGVWVLYPNFNMTVAKTGRLSSSKPMNFQNQPRLAEFRSLYIARPGRKLVIADAKQIELRFLAHFSNDPALVGPYSDPSRDLHQETADFLELPGKDGRYVAKTFNFAEVYEVYGNTAAMQLFRDTEGEIDWTKEQAQKVLDRLRAGRPLVKRWKLQTINYCEAHGYIKTIEGLYRRLPGIKSQDWGQRKYAERQGINAKIQGSVKDLFARLLGMPLYRGILRLQVHDEVVCEVVETRDEETALDVVRSIESFTERYQMRVPILADVGIGDDWSAKA